MDANYKIIKKRKKWDWCIKYASGTAVLTTARISIHSRRQILMTRQETNDFSLWCSLSDNHQSKLCLCLGVMRLGFICSCTVHINAIYAICFLPLCSYVKYKSYGTMHHFHSGKILHIFPLAPKVWEIGDPKRLTRVRGQVYTCQPNLVVIDQLWQAVGLGMTDRHPDRQKNRMEWQ